MKTQQRTKYRDASEITAETKYTLLTNIDFCQLNQCPTVRMDCHAVLIEEGTLGFGDEVGYRIRGFGMDSAWPVFTIWLDNKTQLPFTIGGQVRDNSVIMLSHSGEANPIFSGYVLTLADGTALYLQSSDPSKPLDISRSTGDVLSVWAMLEQKTDTYWHAPNRPYLTWGPPRQSPTSFAWLRR